MTKLLRMKEVTERTGKTRSSIYRDFKRDLFPKPVKLSDTTVAWVETEIDDWIASRIADREAA